jgi:hypothetical protein
MEDSELKLKICDTAMYGSFLRPLISEGALTNSPQNLTIVKKGIYAWILDPAKIRSDPDWILCYITKYHLLPSYGSYLWIH